MPKTKVQKQDIVKELTDKLASAKTVVLTDYQGLTMSQLSQVRETLETQQAELIVTKNNLLEISLKDNNYPTASDSLLVGPTATLLAYEDEISPLKTLTKAFKDFSIGKVKGGYLNRELLSGEQVQTLSQLPSKDELRAKVVGSLGAPLYGIVGVLQANIRNLVYTIDQIRVSKGGE